VEKIAHASVGWVPVLVYIIAGLPGSSLEELLADVRFLAGLPSSLAFLRCIFCPEFHPWHVWVYRKTGGCCALCIVEIWRGFAAGGCGQVWKYVRMINHLKKNGHPEHNDPSLMYFSRSLREKVWYRMDKQGKCDSHFPVTVDLPDKILITRPNGEKMDMDFSLV